MEREAFVCPFCGAPQGYELQPGTIQAKCRYCGSTILVPSELGGLYQQCPNHPGVASIGLCNRCGKAFCDQCLHVVQSEDTQFGELGITSQYFCRECLEKWKSELVSDLVFALPCGSILTVFGLVILLIGLATGILGIIMIGLGSIPLGLLYRDVRNRLKSGSIQLPPTVQEKREAVGELRTVKRTVCLHCKAEYLYGPGQIRADRTVICQNCNQPIKLEDA